MIPKIIHYCWLSNDPYPDNIQKCIDSWKKYLPDYEIVLWNFDRFPKGKSQWVDQAFDSHRYAFAADYLRLYALYNYGGIYLDSDVEVLKSFDNLLHLPYFIGQENTTSGIEAATMGFEKGHPLIKAMLEFYEGKDFINQDGSYNDEALPYIIRRCIETRYDYHLISNTNEFVNDINKINILPIDWFSPKHWFTKEVCCTENTYSIHHFAASWKSNITEEKQESTPKNKMAKNALDRIIFKTQYKLCKSALKSEIFSRLFLFFYNGEHFYISRTMWIYKPDYKKLLHLGHFLKDSQLEFILPETSKHNTSGNIVPIAKIKGSDIEIHHQIPNKYELVRREDFISEFISNISK